MFKLVLNDFCYCVFFNVAVKHILQHFQGLERLGDFIMKIAEEFVLLFDQGVNKKVNKYFDIRRCVQMTS
jgi:hypothetical protein